MANMRMISQAGSPQIVRGTLSYTGSPGTFQDVPLSDVTCLTGYTPIALSGPTSQRPLPPNISIGGFYIDLTIGLAIVWDGNSWRNPVTSAIV